MRRALLALAVTGTALSAPAASATTYCRIGPVSGQFGPACLVMCVAGGMAGRAGEAAVAAAGGDVKGAVAALDPRDITCAA